MQPDAWATPPAACARCTGRGRLGSRAMPPATCVRCMGRGRVGSPYCDGACAKKQALPCYAGTCMKEPAMNMTGTWARKEKLRRQRKLGKPNLSNRCTARGAPRGKKADSSQATKMLAFSHEQHPCKPGMKG
eukprot:1160677-Pelagomonas_calceolata.AAC.6